MLPGIIVALLMVALLAGLTVLRMLLPANPHADLLMDLLDTKSDEQDA